MRELERMGLEPDIDHYEVVYTAPLLPYKDQNTMLEELYAKFNVSRPDDFTGHSLSVSDIVALRENGVVSCHYVDSIGFPVSYTHLYYYVKTKGSLVNQKISFARTVEMKLAMFECYNDFFKHVLDEDAYERKRLQVYHFLVDAAKDGFVFPATIPGTQKLGEERSQALQEVISEDGIIVEKYRDRKLLERYLESVALKYDMTLAELSLLLYRKDAGKALTRGAEAQMPAREDAVEATDRKDAGKALSRKDLAELMHMSRGDLRAALQKLVSRGMLEVVDVPRKRREAAEIAEATGLFGKRGEAQDADANGMTKKKREPRKIRLELLPASDAVLQDIAAAERDYEQAKFRGFTEDELRQYTALERRVQENEKQILQK